MLFETFALGCPYYPYCLDNNTMISHFWTQRLIVMDFHRKMGSYFAATMYVPE